MLGWLTMTPFIESWQKKETPSPHATTIRGPTGREPSITFSGAGILSNSDNKKAAEMFLEFLLSTVGYQYFASQTFEYPLKKGVAPALGLPPISEIYGPGIPLWELTDLEGTQALLMEAGVLP